MDMPSQRLAQIEPQIVHRECGGWLATTPASAALRMGVTAVTEDEARAKFRQAVSRWAESLQADEP